MKDFKTIKIEERADGIAILTLNRPERRNALNFELIAELQDCLTEVENSPVIRVLIMTGAGSAFSSGLDLKEAGILDMTKVPEEYKKFKYLTSKDKVKRSILFAENLVSIIHRLRQIPQPVIAAVNGPAIGGGFALALAADIRLAGTSATFCNAFINIGVSGADMGTSYWLPRIVGFSRAAELMYTGRTVLAEDADRMGLVSRVVPDTALQEESLALAQAILSKNPIGVRFTKEALNANVDALSLETATKLENRTQILCAQTKDSKEAQFAYLEKRPPAFETNN